MQIYLATLFLRLLFDPVNFQHADRERNPQARTKVSCDCKMRMGVVLRITPHVTRYLYCPQNIYIYICIRLEGTCMQTATRQGATS